MTRLNLPGRSFDFGGTMAYRLLGMVATFAAGLLMVAVLTQRFGAAEYAAFALMASFLNLLPFADLGLGASVVNATADAKGGSLSPRSAALHVSRARDILFLVALVISLSAGALFAAGLWPAILGTVDSQGLPLAATFTFICVGVCIPLGLGNRLLQGIGRTRLAMQLSLIGPFTQLLAGVGLYFLGAPAVIFAFIPASAYLLVNAAIYVVATRVSEIRLRIPLSALFRWRDDDVPLANSAIPFLVISTALAIGFQSHRTILAWLGTPAELAEYSLVAQFAGPILTLLAVAAQNLWSRYRVDLAQGSLTRKTYLNHVLLFASAGAIAATGLAGVLHLIAPGLTGSSIAPEATLLIGAGIYIIVVATHQPGAMLLNTPAGLWIQASLVSVAAVVGVLLMVWLIPIMGSAAPYICFAGSMLIIQVIPTIFVSLITISKRAARNDVP